jgi:hypothetical protein
VSEGTATMRDVGEQAGKAYASHLQRAKRGPSPVPKCDGLRKCDRGALLAERRKRAFSRSAGTPSWKTLNQMSGAIQGHQEQPACDSEHDQRAKILILGPAS